MPQGFEVYNAAGALVAGVTTRQPRVLGIITVNSNGSLVDAGFSTGSFWRVLYFFNSYNGPVMTSGAHSSQEAYISVTVAGTTMSWTETNHPTAPGTFTTTSIVYGVY